MLIMKNKIMPCLSVRKRTLTVTRMYFICQDTYFGEVKGTEYCQVYSNRLLNYLCAKLLTYMEGSLMIPGFLLVAFKEFSSVNQT